MLTIAVCGKEMVICGNIQHLVILVLLTEHGLFLLYELSITCSLRILHCVEYYITSALVRETQSCKRGEIFSNKLQYAFRQLSLKCRISRTIIDIQPSV